MSDRDKKRNEHEKHEKHGKHPGKAGGHTQQDVDEAVMAADDTGMVRNEADIVTAEIEEGGGKTR